MASRKTKRLLVASVLVTFVAIACVGGLYLGKVSSLRNPPAGKLIAADDGWRIYHIDRTDPEMMRELKIWAAKWGDRNSTNKVGYGGDLAGVTIMNSGTMVLPDGRRFAVPKGKLQLYVKDTPLTMQNFWRRVTTLFN